MSYPGATMAPEEVTTVRETCHGCGADLTAMDSYLAQEGLRELEIVVWRCPGCDGTSETSHPVPEAA